MGDCRGAPMNQWHRLAFTTAMLFVILWVGTRFTDHWTASAAPVVIGILMAPLAQRFSHWVDFGTSASSGDTPSQISQPAPVGDAGTVVLIAGTNLWSLLALNLGTDVLLNDLRQLEQAKLLALSDLGFAEAQKYFFGLLLFLVWIPALTTTAMTLSGSARRLGYFAFLLGMVLSFLVYYATSGLMGLNTGLGQTEAMLAQAPTLHSADPSVITALSVTIQLVRALAICCVFALYTFVVARGARVIGRIPGKIRWPRRASS